MNILKSTTLFMLLCLISSIYSQSQDKTITLQGTIFDQYPDYNNNFEPPGGSVTLNMVQTTIDSATRTPSLVSLDAGTTPNKNGRMVSPNLFKYFYQNNQNAPLTSNSGANVPIAISIVLTLDEKKGVYVYDNQRFFPIDSQGFDKDSSYRKYKDGSTYHNFHFCLKLNTRFTYGGYETFNFVGDDDVWVFINDKLAVDLGGLHSREEKSVDLTKISPALVKGKVYNFDFFYCERHTTASTIRIETNIQIYCPYYDYCGTCSGDGSTCCNPLNQCNDNNACTTDACPPPTTEITGDISKYCTHVEKKCDTTDKCVTLKCNPSTGNCDSTKIDCVDKTSQCLINPVCNSATGCQYKSMCTSPCHTGNCVNGGCELKTNSTCSSELHITDPCKISFCDTKLGCVSQPLCKQDPNVCLVPQCNVVDGKGVCSNKVLSPTDCECGCDAIIKGDKCLLNNCVDGKCQPKKVATEDGNECTIDECNSATGEITHKPVDTCSGCKTCNPTDGTCVAKNTLCDDGNACTVDICSDNSTNVGHCTVSETNCVADQDKCKNYLCDPLKGCYSEPVVCPDSGNCQVGVCDSTQGCLLVPRTCASEAYCLVTECDESVGCISYDRRCSADDGRCQRGVCVNGTTPEEGECKSVDYDPQPFICKTAAVVSTAVIAGVTVAGAVALAAFIFGGKKGYDYWKESRNVSMSGSNSNPLYEQNPNGGVNPLYNDNATL